MVSIARYLSCSPVSIARACRLYRTTLRCFGSFKLYVFFSFGIHWMCSNLLPSSAASRSRSSRSSSWNKATIRFNELTISIDSLLFNNWNRGFCTFFSPIVCVSKRSKWFTKTLANDESRVVLLVFMIAPSFVNKKKKLSRNSIIIKKSLSRLAYFLLKTLGW